MCSRRESSSKLPSGSCPPSIAARVGPTANPRRVPQVGEAEYQGFLSSWFQVNVLRLSRPVLRSVFCYHRTSPYAMLIWKSSPLWISRNTSDQSAPLSLPLKSWQISWARSLESRSSAELVLTSVASCTCARAFPVEG